MIKEVRYEEQETEFGKKQIIEFKEHITDKLEEFF